MVSSPLMPKKPSVLPPTSTQHLALQILSPHLCYPLPHTPAMKLALLCSAAAPSQRPQQQLVVGTFPSAWRFATTVPIPKPGKDPTVASSHKPISLLSNTCKVFNLAEASLPSLSHRRSTFLVWTYTKLASSPRCHALHSLLLRHGRDPLHGPLPYQTHTPFVDRALSFFAILLPLSSSLKNLSSGPLVPTLFLSLSLSLHTSTQWFKVSCPVQGRILFTSLLHSQYHTLFHIYTDGSRLTNPLSVGAAIYIPFRSLATAWQLLATASITTAKLFAIKEGLQFATTFAALA
ncbi:hypothetical protein E2C01_021238 [Portunus trituberculatus]|uniref:RNase H type-1 domain-containing protein n=1 Tax=Portunus trituberculatus TaxID=210409 RepID=A0A5B7E3V2_PORTR|nr:hypothetical protein [Portunus trituberculatus]